jgi:hypothetical protein
LQKSWFALSPIMKLRGRTMWHMMLDFEAVAFIVIVSAMGALAVAVAWP